MNKGFDEIAAELEAQGWYKEAELLRRFPRSGWDDELVKGMFVAAVSVRDIDRAEKVAQQLVAFAPENPFAHLALCLVKLRQGQTDEAAKAFDRALHFASTLPTYRAQKIHWFCLQGKLKEAQQILRETLKEHPDRWEVRRAQAHLWLSRAKLSSERTKRAIDLLNRLSQYHPDDAVTHALLAQAFWKLRERKQARMHLRLMAKKLPTLTFTDVDAFVVWAIVKATLTICFPWLKPNWLLERFLLRWLPPRYFVAVSTLWGMVALILASLKLFAPASVFAVLVLISSIAFVYNRFADIFLLWFLKKTHDDGN